MKKLRMTVEELNALNPSYDKPIELVCDDGVFNGLSEVVSIIAPVINGVYVRINKVGEVAVINEENLRHYPSFKEEKEEWETCREALWNDQIVLVFKDERMLSESNESLYKHKYGGSCAIIQGGREFEVNFKTNEIRVKQ